MEVMEKNKPKEKLWSWVCWWFACALTYESRGSHDSNDRLRNLGSSSCANRLCSRRSGLISDKTVAERERERKKGYQCHWEHPKSYNNQFEDEETEKTKKKVYRRWVNFGGFVSFWAEQRMRIRVYMTSQTKGVWTLACLPIDGLKRRFNEKE